MADIRRFEEYEWRWKIKDRSKDQRHFSQPLWDGRKSLKGKKILLWCEQGVGDTINWSYCLPFIASQAEHCILECQEKLVPLIARSFPNVEVKHENRSLDAEKYDFDYHLPMGSLYRHCITKLPLDFKSMPILFRTQSGSTFGESACIPLEKDLTSELAGKAPTWGRHGFQIMLPYQIYHLF